MSAPSPPPDITDPAVARVFDAADGALRARMFDLRRLIFDVARTTDGVGPLTETLKWGQPAYLTEATKSGTTIRIAPTKSGNVALYTHCQSTVIEDFRAIAPDNVEIEGNRGVHLKPEADLPTDALRILIQSALTYHLGK